MTILIDFTIGQAFVLERQEAAIRTMVELDHVHAMILSNGTVYYAEAF